MKWALAFGVALAGRAGARIVAATESALAVSLLFAFGRIAFGRAVGTVAGAIGVFLPLWVAYGRIAGHESHVLLVWTASLLALGCWLRSFDTSVVGVSTPVEQGDPIAAFACVFAATIGLWSRANVLWIFPILGAMFFLRVRGTVARGLIPIPLAAISGAIVATGLTFAAWPYLWMRPFDQGMQLAYLIGPGRPTTPIAVYLGELTIPAWHYFIVAFAAETPVLLLVAAACGVAISFTVTVPRWSALLCLLWLVLPFAQSISTVRINAGRYVSDAWPALLLFAAVGLVTLGRLAERMLWTRRAWLRWTLRSGPAILALAYTWDALRRIEPYPLDYFNELVGGAAGVAATQMFEVPWWGEGNLAAIRTLDQTAPHGARVFLALWPKHVLARLRDDLVVVADRTSADYVLVSHLQYFEKPPAGCLLESTVRAGGAPLVDIYHCLNVAPPLLGAP